ncbi:DUF2066 domain-containing protein [Sinimarinibacterium thermocellulolyticum]|uniref:DUF2066 domain-containing protein n=1 Tax=Sinimarinibacterium thermocellulolyticum TaxID=3170016 RepID=A0ABV2AB78_9GAMM
MRNPSILSATLATFLWSLAATAQPPDPLRAFEARVPVTDQSAPVRDEALREALRQVITTVSGPEAEYVAADLLAQAAQLVQHYGYQQDAEYGLMLVAGFDGNAVERRLKALQLPIWGVHAAAVEDVLLRISELRGRDAYLHVLARLRGLPGVQDVLPTRAIGDTLELRVRIEGGAGRLGGALMSAYELAPDMAVDGVQLAYRYQGVDQKTSTP